MRAFKYYNLIKQFDWDHAEALAVLQHESTDKHDQFSKNVSPSDYHDSMAPAAHNDYNYDGVIGYKDEHVDFTITPWRGSYGLFQVGAFTLVKNKRTGKNWYTINGQGLTNVKQLFDPANNIAMAYNLWRQHRDWRDWSAYKNGSYKQSLPAAKQFILAQQQQEAKELGKHAAELNAENVAQAVQAASQLEPKPQPVQQPKAAPTRLQAPPAIKAEDIKRTARATFEQAFDQTGKVVSKTVTEWLGKKKSDNHDEGVRVAKKLGWANVLNAKLHLFVLDLEKAHPVLADNDWALALAIAGILWGLYWLVGKISFANYKKIKRDIEAAKPTGIVFCLIQRALGSRKKATESARESGDWAFYNRVYG